jgi:hypothetical protein
MSVCNRQLFAIFNIPQVFFINNVIVHIFHSFNQHPQLRQEKIYTGEREWEYMYNCQPSRDRWFCNLGKYFSWHQQPISQLVNNCSSSTTPFLLSRYLPYLDLSIIYIIMLPLFFNISSFCTLWYWVLTLFLENRISL